MNSIQKRTLFLFFIITFLFFVITLLVSIVFSRVRDGGVAVEEEEKHFRFLHYDSISQTGYEGIVTKEKSAKEHFYHDNENYFLISKFGESGEAFRCSGTCYCEETDTRRSFSTTTRTTTKSLIYLVTAISSFIAIRRAKEYFNEECILEMSKDDGCKSSKIKSTIDDCETFSNEDSSSSSSSYFCHGSCEEKEEEQPTKKMRPQFEDLKHLSDDTDVEELAESQQGGEDYYYHNPYLTERELEDISTYELELEAYKNNLIGQLGHSTCGIRSLQNDIFIPRNKEPLVADEEHEIAMEKFKKQLRGFCENEEEGKCTDTKNPKNIHCVKKK